MNLLQSCSLVILKFHAENETVSVKHESRYASRICISAASPVQNQTDLRLEFVLCTSRKEDGGMIHLEPRDA